MRRISASVHSMIAILAFAGAARAACGLHICPRHQEPATHAWQISWAQSQSGFAIAGTSGTYSEGAADVRYTHGDRWTAAIHVPFLALDAGARTRFGLSNPTALAEHRWHLGDGAMIGLGLQAELPLGDAEAGLAQEHFMFMPYLSASKSFPGFFLGGSAGVSKALGSHDHASMEGMDMGTMAGMDHSAFQGIGAPLYVRPHEDFEATYRFSSGVPLWSRRFFPEVFLSGQHVLTRNPVQSEASDFLSAGISAPISLGRYRIAPEAEIPVTAEHRFEWEVGMGIGINL